MHIYVTNDYRFSFCKKMDAYNGVFLTKFATFLRAVPNMVRWGHLKFTQTRIIEKIM